MSDETYYKQLQKKAGFSEKKYIQHIDIYQYEPYFYAAIQKRKGDDSYAQVLQTGLTYGNSLCQQTQNKFGWICAGYMYFFGDISLQQTQSIFNRQPMLDPKMIGSEKFILTSPDYYGMSQHSEFEALANAFLDRTFRKWNPDLVPEKATPSPTK